MDRGTRATPENRGAEAAARYRGDAAAPSRQPGRRPRHVFELEDYLLAGWVVLLEYGLQRFAGDPGGITNPFVLNRMLSNEAASPEGWLSWLASLTPIGWVVLGLFLFVLLTRGPEDTDRDVALHRRTPMLALALPVLSIYALIATGIQRLTVGIDEHPASGLPPWPGPYVPRVVRRTAAVPLAFIGDAMFRAELQQTDLLTFTPASLAEVVSPGLLFLVIASAFPFMIFVAGPRIAAGADMAWRPWIIRFALFFVATWAGNTGWTW